MNCWKNDDRFPFIGFRFQGSKAAGSKIKVQSFKFNL